MGFLHKLWDEILAGPAPENGLGKLRINISGENVTRIGHPKLMVDPGRVPDSPVGSNSPGSPLTRKLYRFLFLIHCLSLFLYYEQNPPKASSQASN